MTDNIRQHYFVVAATVNLDTHEVEYSIDLDQTDNRFGSKTIWDQQKGNWLLVTPITDAHDEEIYSNLSESLQVMKFSLSPDTES